MLKNMVLSRTAQSTCSRVCAAFYSAMVSDFRDTFASSYTSDNAHDDRRYLARRLAHEGESFAFSAMPALGRSLNEALVTGVLHIPSESFRVVPGSALPRIFHSIWKLVFSDTGKILVFDEGSDLERQVLAIRALRQITLVWSKRVTTPSDDTVDKAVAAFVDRTALGLPVWAQRDIADELYARFDDFAAGRVLEADNRRMDLIRRASREVDVLFQDGKLSDRIFPQTHDRAGAKAATLVNTVQARFKKVSYKETSGPILSTLPASIRRAINRARIASSLEEGAAIPVDL